MKEKVPGMCSYQLQLRTTHPAENAAHSPMITVNAYSAVVCSLIDVGGGAADVIWEVVAPQLLMLVQ
jgi:hypothetical protein